MTQPGPTSLDWEIRKDQAGPQECGCVCAVSERSVFTGAVQLTVISVDDDSCAQINEGSVNVCVAAASSNRCWDVRVEV